MRLLIASMRHSKSPTTSQNASTPPWRPRPRFLSSQNCAARSVDACRGYCPESAGTARASAIGAADFNGDGTADILWQNADGTPAVWLMDGLSVVSGANVGFDPGSNWHVV